MITYFGALLREKLLQRLESAHYRDLQSGDEIPSDDFFVPYTCSCREGGVSEEELLECALYEGVCAMSEDPVLIIERRREDEDSWSDDMEVVFEPKQNKTIKEESIRVVTRSPARRKPIPVPAPRRRPTAGAALASCEDYEEADLLRPPPGRRYKHLRPMRL